VTTATAPPPPLSPVAVQDDTELASWARRVVAALLDGAILSAIAFVADGWYETPPLGWLVGVGEADPAPGSWWNLVGFVALLVLQAYTGATPGKRVMSIVVVGERDGRPVGLLRTIARQVCHLLDAILFIGYLRPLWNARRQTFADSICRTEVRRSGPGRTRAGRAATVAAFVACSVGAAFMVGPVGVSVPPAASSCQVRYDEPDTSGPDGMPRIRLDAVRLQVPQAARAETRLGITRAVAETDVPDVYPVSWEHSSVPGGQLPPEGSTLELTLVAAGATPGAPTVRATVENGGFVLPGGATVEFAGSSDPWTLDLPRSEVDALGPGWTWEGGLRVPGRDVMSCGAPGPAGS
jgi:Mce-associated membrane protein